MPLKEYKELEYEDTIEASSHVPAELRIMLQKMREKPLSKEEEIWGELLEERMNFVSQTRGQRDMVEMNVAMKEFTREFCRNRGIEHTSSDYLEELKELRERKRITSPRMEVHAATQKIFRGGPFQYAVLAVIAGGLWFRYQQKRISAQEEGMKAIAALEKREAEAKESLESFQAEVQKAAPQIAEAMQTRREAGASKEANDKEEEVRKILTAALERSKTYAKQ
mmetsp:Transcript_2613/g.7859  ORF Transcript_2613/g.7859 Transcript_2613/m.7859 type:complete len:224 (+) Transcript_2613:83-754(+)